MIQAFMIFDKKRIDEKEKIFRDITKNVGPNLRTMKEIAIDRKNYR